MGYGDYSPSDDRGRLLSILFLFVGIVMVGGILQQYTAYVVKCIEAAAEQDKSLNANEMVDGDDLSVDKISLYEKEQRLKHQWWSIKFSILAVLSCVVGGGGVMMYLMKWSWITALYWAMVTSMTVGYGDLSIPNDAGIHWFVTFYMIITTMTVSISLGKVFEVFSAWDNERKRETLMKNLNLSAILKKFEEKNDYEVQEDEFVLFMLQQTMGLNYNKDVLPFVKKFKELDMTGNGSLSKEDMVLFAQKIESKKLQKGTRREENGMMKYIPMWIRNIFVKDAKVVVAEAIPLAQDACIEKGVHES